ncbi:MAG: glycosyltransferase family 2 protein [Patescibacteria group bacterium]
MSLNPKISVIIPTHNRPELLERAIQSVLCQTFQDFEIIVIDDGLEKRADKIISQISDERIQYIQNIKNLGASASRNVGINKAKGKYITFLDDDDEFYPEKIEKQYQIIEASFEKIDFVYCIVDVYSQQSGDFIYTQKHDFKEGVQSFFEEALSLKMAVATPSIFCKKKKVLEIGGFDENFPNAEDKDFFIRLSKNSQGFFINQSLVKVNFFDEKENRLSGNLKSRIIGREMLIKKYNTDLFKRPKILGKHLFLLAFLYQEDGNLKKTQELFFQAWKLDKTNFIFLKQILKNLYLRFFQKTFNKKSR